MVTQLAFIPQKVFMERALELASEAFCAGEVPVGAVVEKDGVIIGEGRNRREEQNNALCHAEIIAINRACEKLSSWRLTGCRLYVTLEPCPMCMGAAINARLDKIVFAASDEAAGCCGGICDLSKLPFACRMEIFPGFMEMEAVAIIKKFFGKARKKK